MSQYYPQCGDELLDHWCDPCDEGEGDGVRSIFLYKDGTFSATPTTQEFRDGVTNGNIVIIPETRGTFDGGAPTYGKGFGDRTTTFESADYKLTYTDPNYYRNRSYYNSAQSQTQWNIGWRSETLIHLSEKKVTMFGKDPHTDDNKKKIYWEVETTWTSKNKPLLFPTPSDVFECFQDI